MTHRRHICLSFALALLVGTPTHAQERATREEARALAEAAAAHLKKVGFDQAAKDFNVDKAKWQPKDLYPFVQDFAGVMRFHANDKMMSRNVLELRDSNGKEFVKEMIRIAKGQGAGWIDYEWAHPQTRKVEDKSSYVVRIPGTELYVGVGVYR